MIVKVCGNVVLLLALFCLGELTKKSKAFSKAVNYGSSSNWATDNKFRLAVIERQRTNKHMR